MTIERPRLLSLATALPPHILAQDEALIRFERIYGHRIAAFDRVAEIFRNTGIERRHAVVPLDWFEAPRGWPERTEAFLAGALALWREAADTALARAGLRPSDIDEIVTVSSTGIATPSLEARLLPDMGFRPDVRRVPVFGLGCAGGVSGLSLAARLAARGGHVLMVAVETCTLAFRGDELSKANIVATALFGDGAAAAVLGPGTGPMVEHEGEHLWAGTLDIMGWQVDPVGFGVVLSRSIPDFVTREIRVATERFLDSAGLRQADVARPVFHPGGARVVEALERAFSLPAGHLDVERAVLRDCGNMSSPTALFVLERVLAQGASGRLLMGALGPGFTASFATLVTDA